MNNKENTSIDSCVYDSPGTESSTVPDEVMEKYKSNLSMLLGYTTNLNVDALNMEKAREYLDAIPEDKLISSKIDDEKGYETLKSIEEQFYLVTDAMGLDRKLMRDEIYDISQSLNKMHLSTTLDALDLAIQIYERAQLDRVA